MILVEGEARCVLTSYLLELEKMDSRRIFKNGASQGKKLLGEKGAIREFVQEKIMEIIRKNYQGKMIEVIWKDYQGKMECYTN